jgi:two-component system chemotaxis response regulator CheY
MTRSLVCAVASDIDGVETYEAKTGFEALKMLPARKYDLIVTDINMPDINGLELINFVKGDERYSVIPMLIISTEKSEEDRRRGLEMGADAYLSKPFRAEELMEILKRLLNA